MKARFKYRIYPTELQKNALSKLFGCARTVWNDALDFCVKSFKKGEKYCKEAELQKRFITQAKKTENRRWLSEVSNITLQQSIRDLGQAYQNFFKSCKGQTKGKKIRLLRFKKRKSAQSAKFIIGGFKVHQHNVYLAKIGKLKIVWSRPLPSEPSSVTIIKDSADRYFLSFVVEMNTVKLPDNGNAVGIDLGITDFATFSHGEKVKAPKPLKKHLEKLRSLQRKLSNKPVGSKRREVARIKVAKLHAKISDTRTDFLHKLSTKVIRENQTIALEDLNVSGMVKNRKLSRAISDLRSFRTMLEAKATMYGRDLRVINRWEPTSQKCFCCGEKGGKKELSVREWTCLFCGKEHDRDINASKNILKVAGGQSETKKRT
ncbi:RNA-guided endonuclease InsQ/TnpB family protein [Nostoc sp.]|uniref:RNA-guided endonuclease InsQ/TnpB family protein n=1 Tax=Nostoc sp. TaxID=1180 RepID=UPI002FFAB2D8